MRQSNQYGLSLIHILSDFTRLFSYYYDNLTKEEFRAKMVEWGELYIEYREKNEDMDENLNQE